jgi:hypothetical protein
LRVAQGAYRTVVPLLSSPAATRQIFWASFLSAMANKKGEVLEPALAQKEL